jgi:acetyl-CoA carboxylase biotin carboxyl carrier protein
MKKHKLKKIIKVFEQSDLAKMEFEYGNIIVKLEKPGSEDRNRQIFDESSVNLHEKYTWVLSPLVGTFLSAPGMDAKPYVSLGDEVQVNDVLCVIEAMKIMNELKCKTCGTVVEVAVEDRSMVQYGQPLFRIREHD